MSSIYGIVAEFNPFHNGHQNLIQQARSSGATAVVAVMSGNYVQRGEPAITEKRVRTHMALLGGVDLVLELPVFYSCSPAERFAYGSVYLLQSTGIVDTLCFGSESGNLSELLTLSQTLNSPPFQTAFRHFITQGYSFPKSKDLALRELFPSQKLSLTPNNILAIEYIRAAQKLNWNIDFFTIPRQGVSHDSNHTQENFASASLLRSYQNQLQQQERFLPANSYQVLKTAQQNGLYPISYQTSKELQFSYLRRLSKELFFRLPDCSEGLEQRFYKAVQRSHDLDEVFSYTKTKRYPLARIRRLSLSAFLEFQPEQTSITPPYLRVLGATPTGVELLKTMKKTATLPLSHSLAKLRDKDEISTLFAEQEALSTNLYTLSLPKILPAGYDFSAPAVFLSKKEIPK